MSISPTRERRKWEAFPGKNSFCCDGRCICARSLLTFYSSLVMIIVPSILFFAFESRFLAVSLSPLIPVVAAVQFVFVLSTLIFACCTDPGIVPRATPAEAQWILTEIGGLNPPAAPPRVKEVMINNRLIKLKYCYTCKIFRPPRTSHCSSCDSCVERFDHHCPWVGNCVGRRNYRYFFMFVSSLTLYCAYLLAFTITNFVLLGLKYGFVNALKSCPLSIVVLLSAFFGMWAVGGIAMYHVSLIAREVSTNEAIKGTFNDKQCGRSNNPFTRGNFLGNMLWMLCGPIYPSLIHIRQPMDVEELEVVSGSLIPADEGLGYCHPVLSMGARGSGLRNSPAPASLSTSYPVATSSAPAAVPPQSGYANDVTVGPASSSSAYASFGTAKASPGDNSSSGDRQSLLALPEMSTPLL